MLLSRPRILLRAALLAIGAGYMGWRSALSWRAARELPGDAGLLQGRLALVFALVGLLALLTAGSALAALRARKRVATLQLRAPGSEPDVNPPAPDRLPGSGDRT